jgi:outer membrane biosynthesis protein TonB
MEGWRAGLFALGIVLIGFGGYASLEGVWKGGSLAAAGIALVLLGLSLERSPRPATEPRESEEEGAPEGSDAVTVEIEPAPLAEPEPEPTAPLAAEPEPTVELATEPEPELAEPEPTAPLATEPEPEPEPEPAQAPSAVGAHVHEQPMLGHSELVSHLRDEHEGVPFDGSTIQLRLLHERAHAG